MPEHKPPRYAFYFFFFLYFFFFFFFFETALNEQ